AGEVGIERCVVLIDRMMIAPGGIRLPDLDQGIRHRPLVLVEHPADHDDALAQRLLPVWRSRVRSFSPGSSLMSLKSGPVISESVCRSGTSFLSGPRFTDEP